MEVDKEKLLKGICECQPCTFEDLIVFLGWSGDLRPLRRAIADLIREGLVEKKPDYNRKKLVYVVSSGVCG